MDEAGPAQNQMRIVVPGPAELSRSGAREFVGAAKEALNERGRFAVALSGGNTPRAMHHVIAEEYSTALPWDQVFIFFGDERHVPPDHPESNYRMAKETLLSRVPIPEQNVFRIPAELPAEGAASQYEKTLRQFFSLNDSGWPRFDLILLGMGDDGHTASLFPNTSALNEERRLVVASRVEKFETERITLTLPVLNHAAEVVFLVAGRNKAEILSRVFQHQTPPRFPVERVRPADGRVVWLLDEAAAHLL